MIDSAPAAQVPPQEQAGPVRRTRRKHATPPETLKKTVAELIAPVVPPQCAARVTDYVLRASRAAGVALTRPLTAAIVAALADSTDSADSPRRYRRIVRRQFLAAKKALKKRSWERTRTITPRIAMGAFQRHQGNAAAAGRELGVSGQTVKKRIQKNPDVFLNALERAGLSDQKLFSPIQSALSATKTAVHEGRIIESTAPDHAIRLEAAEMALKLKGKFEDAKKGTEINVSSQIVNIIRPQN